MMSEDERQKEVHKRINFEEDILSSLNYLCAYCKTDEDKSILGMTIQLCHGLLRLDLQETTSTSLIDGYRDPEDIRKSIASLDRSLTYLRAEARRHNMNEIAIILDAAQKLCFLVGECLTIPSLDMSRDQTISSQ